MNFFRNKNNQWEFNNPDPVAQMMRIRRESLQLKAEHKELPEFLTLEEIAILSDKPPGLFEKFIEQTNLEITESERIHKLANGANGTYKVRGATRNAYKAYLISKGLWPVEGLLANWWPDNQAETEPPAPARHSKKTDQQNHIKVLNDWEIADPRDAATKYAWYTAARFFARKIAAADPTLLTKKSLLRGKISKALFDVGIKAKGGKPYDPESIKKALVGFDYSQNP